MKAASRFAPSSSPSLIALPAVMQMTGHCRAGVYKAILAQLLPRPVKVGRASRWPEDEVLAVRAAMLRGDDDGSRRALVRQLQARRGGPHMSLVSP
ncbi:MAG TPA: AlpA family phage regulatory protein [Burkholderiaceae bacterium]|nr:AlpA family phage regulatory protein [Burkholderiaceae bacterium]